MDRPTHPLIGRRLWFSLPVLLWRSLSLCVSGFASFVLWSLCHLCLISFSSVFKVLSCFPSSCLCFPGISFCLLEFVVSCFFSPSSLIKAQFLLPGLDPVFCIFNTQNNSFLQFLLIRVKLDWNADTPALCFTAWKNPALKISKCYPPDLSASAVSLFF